MAVGPEQGTQDAPQSWEVLEVILESAGRDEGVIWFEIRSESAKDEGFFNPAQEVLDFSEVVRLERCGHGGCAKSVDPGRS